MKFAIRVGLKPYEAELLTPYELNLMINEHNEKCKEDSKADIVAAFYFAYFQRLKTLSSSDLETVLEGIDGANKQAMSDEEMLAVAKRLSTAFGG